MPVSDDPHGSYPPGAPIPSAQPPAYAQQPAYAAPPMHAGAVPPASPYGASGEPPLAGPPVVRHSGRAWLWWLLGIVVVLSLCAGVAALLASIGRSAGAGNLNVGGNTIAVIPFDGTIAGSGVAPSVITPESFLKLLNRAEDDDNVKAIVLRVDSPGGTVAASEEISTFVKNAKKPIVVSVSDMDASGAYMVSSQADKIVANPGSAIGSIGVIMEIPNAAGLLDKIGVSFKVIHAGKYKDAGSPYRSLTPTETSMLQDQLDEVYGQFIDIVASGRHLPRSEVESMATGWAWNGSEAQKMGLVDQIGTYNDALKTAAKLGHIQGEYQTDVYNEADSLSGVLSTLLGIESQLKAISSNTALDPASSGGPALAK